MAYSNCFFFEIGVPNASTVVKERLKDPREFVWYQMLGARSPMGALRRSVR